MSIAGRFTEVYTIREYTVCSRYDMKIFHDMLQMAVARVVRNVDAKGRQPPVMREGPVA